MEELTPILGIVVMFVLRLGVPLLVTALVVIGLRRLDEHWQADAEALRIKQGTDVGQGSDKVALILRPVAQPCWMTRRCAETDYRQCPAYLQPHLPCWEARRQPDGTLMDRCSICTIYQLRIHRYERAYRTEATQFHRD